MIYSIENYVARREYNAQALDGKTVEYDNDNR